MTTKQLHGCRLPLPLRFTLWSGPVLWLLSILDALLRSRNTPDFDSFHWLFYTPAAFDFFDYYDRITLLHSTAFFTHPGYPWYYPAPTILVLLPLYRFSHLFADPASGAPWLAGYLAYLVLALAGFILVITAIARSLVRDGFSGRSVALWAITAALFSWPLYFSLQRGNIEALTWLILAGAVWAFARERWFLMAVLLGLASSFKIYPLFCLALFFPARRWRELALALLTFLLTTLVALEAMGPNLSVAWHGTLSGMQRWVNDYALGYGPTSATYDHSFYELLKVVTLPFHPSYPALLRLDLLVAALLALILFFARVRHLPRSNQVLFLILLCISLPPASLDYTLINLYIPFAWLTLALASNPAQARRPAVITCFALFALVLGPKLFLSFRNITQQGFTTSLLLLGLLAISVISPFPDLEAVSPCAAHPDPGSLPAQPA